MKNIHKYLKPVAWLVSMAMFFTACSFQHAVRTGVAKSRGNIPEGSRPIGLVHAEVWKWNYWYGDDDTLSNEVFQKLQEEAIRRGGDAVVDVSYRTEIHDWFLFVIIVVPLLYGWSEAHASGILVRFPRESRAVNTGEIIISPQIVMADN